MIAAPYHAAVRRSIRAFPTSPIKNILVESGLPALHDNMEDKIFRLYSRLTLSPNPLVRKDFQSAASRVSTPKQPSSIHTCSLFANQVELPIKQHNPRYTHHPPWAASKTSFINDLASLRKDSTPNTVYIAKFSETIAHYKSNDWQLIFTDGSKASHTSYAVVTENQVVVAYGLLFSFCSIFTAEATAIFHAVQYSAKTKGKHIICTDSMSCFQAIQNHNKSGSIIKNIKNTLISFPGKIKIMWIPGHSGIKGNTLADTIAKDISITPTITSEVILPSDIYRLIHSHKVIT
uniref:RNase H type-1 domain-containing protein n=1 Tax=Bactrocera latifrons TaxID=174628 RepID=A0A0K8VGS4_BACLA